MKRVFGDYYLGLDIGTNSVGWAVTDMDYNLLRFNGKDMWGIRLFNSGKTAEFRRTKRTARRRLDRSRERIRLLQQFFSEEITKVDEGFFQRLEDSKFYPDDKSVHQKNTLFNDKNYQDKDYHKEFPTIYHLREALLSDSRREFDVRLVYLAIAHILSHRGHFYYRGSSVSEIPEFTELYSLLHTALEDHADRSLPICNNKLEMIMKSSDKITAKSDRIAEVIGKEHKPVARLLAGGSVQLALLFQDDLLKDADLKNVSLYGQSYDQHIDELEQILGERVIVLEQAKAVYDWAELSRIMQSDNLSKDKIKSYEKHKSDLKILKHAIWTSAGKEEFKEFFSNRDSEANYPAYIGRSLKNQNKSVASRDEFYNEIKKVLPKTSNAPELDYIYREIDKDQFLPKQATNENSVIPYQLHLHELQRILANASKYLQFLNEEDDAGYSTAFKIEKLLTFRIPYYVGPLNPAHKEKGNAWVVTKNNETIRPWNFFDVVDRDKSQEAFIRRMTNKCTYLLGADVLPKQSLLYSKYMVLNEINNLKVDGEGISPAIKQKIYEDLFLVTKKVTPKRIHDYLVSNGYIDRDMIITGIDQDIKSSMSSYIDLKKVLGDEIKDVEFVDNIITMAVIFGEEKSALAERLQRQFADRLEQNQIRKIARMNFSGWGRFSAELLKDIYHTRKDTGEMVNIIRMMWETNENFMQLMTAEKYDYFDEIKKYNQAQQTDELDFSYDALVEPLYCSPAVKRSIWQALKIIDELQKILGHEPKRVFVEVTRGEAEKKRTTSRKQLLSELYAKCKEEAPLIGEKLKTHSEGDLRSKRLFLYYTQMGRCMYSGEPIDLEQLSNDKYYDIDHIYPRSLTKDDSQNNVVLVKANLNRNKGDKYPIPAQYRTEETLKLWESLRHKNLISQEKYDRLVRQTDLGNDELAGFIMRQLVETSQSSKAVANALGTYFNDSEIVYVKSGHVADFRHDNGFIKVREINDHHHAKDAYLNIVVGNVYHTKFTKSPMNFIREQKTKGTRPYSLKRLFDFDVRRGDTTAWTAGDNGTLSQVKKIMNKDSILFTRLAYEETGAFYDEMPMKKGKGQIPLKSTDKRLHDIDRYGAYNKDSGAYFILVEHTRRKKRIRTIEYVPIRIAATIANESDLKIYCETEGVYGLGLENPVVLVKKIKLDTLFKINGFPMFITSRTGKQLVFKSGIQFKVPSELLGDYKKISKFVNRSKVFKNKDLQITERDEIDANTTRRCYDFMVTKASDTIWKNRPNIQAELLAEGRDKFDELKLEQQCEVIMNILRLFDASNTGSSGTDLRLIGGSEKGGTLRRSNNLTNDSQILIIHQSGTGLFETIIDIKQL